jgi:hypothetical protein
MSAGFSEQCTVRSTLNSRLNIEKKLQFLEVTPRKFETKWFDNMVLILFGASNGRPASQSSFLIHVTAVAHPFSAF